MGLVGGVYITSDEGAGLAGVGLVGGVYITSDEGAKLGWSGTCRWCLYYK